MTNIDPMNIATDIIRKTLVDYVFGHQENTVEIKTVPGIGTIHALITEGKARNIDVRDIRMNMFAPRDFDPIPYIGSDGEVHTTKFDPAKFLDLTDAPTLLILNELEHAHPDAIKMFAGLASDTRKVVLVKYS